MVAATTYDRVPNNVEKLLNFPAIQIFKGFLNPDSLNEVRFKDDADTKGLDIAH